MQPVPHESVMGFLADFWKGEARVSCVNIHGEPGEGPGGCGPAPSPQRPSGRSGCLSCPVANWVNCDVRPALLPLSLGGRMENQVQDRIPEGESGPLTWPLLALQTQCLLKERKNE